MELETFFVGGLKVVIEVDEDAESPRKWASGTHMVCWHRRHTLGDEQPRITPQEWRRRHGRIRYYKPLWLYDHSGLSLNTVGPVDEWDSSWVGWIYMLASEAKKSHKGDLDAINARLVAEVDSYNVWLAGDYCQYAIYDEEGVYLAGCCNFDSQAYCREEAVAEAKRLIESLKGNTYAI